MAAVHSLPCDVIEIKEPVLDASVDGLICPLPATSDPGVGERQRRGCGKRHALGRVRRHSHDGCSGETYLKLCDDG